MNLNGFIIEGFPLLVFLLKIVYKTSLNRIVILINELTISDSKINAFFKERHSSKFSLISLNEGSIYLIKQLKSISQIGLLFAQTQRKLSSSRYIRKYISLFFE